MVFQHFNLFNNMNVLRNLMLAPVDLKQCGKEEAKARALTMLECVGLQDKMLLELNTVHRQNNSRYETCCKRWTAFNCH